MATKRHVLDDDAVDANGVVRDGRSLRVPLFLLDSVQREIARVTVRDALGGTAGFRPGFVFAAPYGSSTTARDASADDPRVAAYEQMTRRLTDAWRQPIGDIGSAALRHHATRLHAAATDLEGRLDKEAADKEMAREKRLRHEDGGNARDAAFRDMERRTRDAWKGPDRMDVDDPSEPDDDTRADADAARENMKRYLESAWRGDWNPLPVTAATLQKEVAERLRRDATWRLSHL